MISKPSRLSTKRKQKHWTADSWTRSQKCRRNLELKWEVWRCIASVDLIFCTSGKKLFFTGEGTLSITQWVIWKGEDSEEPWRNEEGARLLGTAEWFSQSDLGLQRKHGQGVGASHSCMFFHRYYVHLFLLFDVVVTVNAHGGHTISAVMLLRIYSSCWWDGIASRYPPTVYSRSTLHKGWLMFTNLSFMFWVSIHRCLRGS